MALYAAIDLHSNNGVLAVIDEHDHVVYSRRLPNELPQVLDAIAPYQSELAAGIAVESTYNWYWLVDGLIEHGYRARLVNTAEVPQYDGLKHGDDHSDAYHLAHLLRLGILPEGYIYPRDSRAVRDLLRRRFHLVRQATALMLSVQSAWSRRTGHGLSANAFRQLRGPTIAAAFADPTERLAVVAQFNAWKGLTTQIDRLERGVLERIPSSAGASALRSVPGIGPILGSTILLETGEISRFAAVGDYASYCRMVASQRLSNGKRKGRGNAKCGNRYLAWAFIEAANYAPRFSPEIRRWHARKLAQVHKVVARKAVAHKLARASYYLLRDGGTFDAARAFG